LTERGIEAQMMIYICMLYKCLCLVRFIFDGVQALTYHTHIEVGMRYQIPLYKVGANKSIMSSFPLDHLLV